MQFAKRDLSAREMYIRGRYHDLWIRKRVFILKLRLISYRSNLAEEISGQSKFFLWIDKLYLSYIEINLALDQG